MLKSVYRSKSVNIAAYSAQDRDAIIFARLPSMQPVGAFRETRLEKKMMQKISRSIIQAWLLSVAILISGAHYNVAQAQDNPKQHRMGVACGKELKKQCSGGRSRRPVVRQTAFSSVSKRAKKTSRKMRCIGEQCCAHV